MHRMYIRIILTADIHRNGNVTLFIQGASGTNGDFAVSDPTTSESKRGFLSSIGHALSSKPLSFLWRITFP